MKPWVLGSLLFLCTVPGLHAEIIKRLNPDGSITYMIPAAPTTGSAQDLEAYRREVERLKSSRPAPVIREVAPDGRVTFTVPARGPSVGTTGTTASSPCEQAPWEPTEAYGARDAYRASLERLKSAPTDHKCREQALNLGRLYSALSRRDGLPTVYDELAVANDVNAAAGGAVRLQQPGGTPVPMGVPAPVPGVPVTPSPLQ